MSEINYIKITLTQNVQTNSKSLIVVKGVFRSVFL